ncbi:YibE/F family protein, partial [Nocardioides sp.]|uniref:YibE/F family protein n=1 Tax=Nocardioides sp. TaxID=35761 RepID=UPI0031FE4D9C|nr:putative rane protein [Nocardioides sp.]
MGHGHSHRAGTDSDHDVEVRRRPRAVLLAALALAGVATVVGLVALWPDAGRADELRQSAVFAAPGTTFPDAVVDRVEPPCEQRTDTGAQPPADTGDASGCGRIHATVATGAGKGTKVRVSAPPQVLASGLSAGDRIRLLAPPVGAGEPAVFSYFGTERSTSLWILALAFAVVVVAVARLRGVFAILGLAFSGLVIWKFALPALLVGESGLLVGLVASAAIMFVVLYSTHGFSIRTSAALAGTLAGVAITAAIGVWSVSSTHLTGVDDESGGVLSAFVGNLSFQGLLTCAIIIAGLGVLNDVTITQASAVWELRGAAPDLTRRQVFARGMRIGR